LAREEILMISLVGRAMVAGAITQRTSVVMVRSGVVPTDFAHAQVMYLSFKACYAAMRMNHGLCETTLSRLAVV
jgi:hypothetical protein